MDSHEEVEVCVDCTRGKEGSVYIVRKGLVSPALASQGVWRLKQEEGRAGGPGGDPAQGTGAQVGTSGIALGCR